jgi:hypothetical protein
MLLTLWCAAACDDGYNLDDQARDSVTRIATQQSFLKDGYGRYLFLHGANVSGSTKVPTTESPVSYVGKPFPLEEADWNFRMLRDMGFNVLRLLIIWDAIEPDASGEYDEEYLDYLEQIVAKARDYGIYVFLDMHQDIFSHWLRKYYYDRTDKPSMIPDGQPGSEAQPPLNNVIQGDGAPRWAIQDCLPDKNVYSPEWGLPRSMVSDPRNTDDLLAPFFWGIDSFLAIDTSRCFATFFAGRDVYPNYLINGKNVQDYLQDSFANAWVQVAGRVKYYDNVLGYDIINEPLGLFIIFDIYAFLYREAKATTDGTLSDEQVEEAVDRGIAELQPSGIPPDTAAKLKELLLTRANLPRNADDFAAAGMPLDAAADDPYKPDLAGVLALNGNFNRDYMQPFYEKVGAAIQDEDPAAIIIIEPSLGFDDTGGVFGVGSYITPMLAPAGIRQLVYGPHFYADVYPIIAVYPEPRDFTVDEVKLRDYTEGIFAAIKLAAFSLGNPPVILGEFGTYFNFGGIETAEAMNYAPSAQILDNYYRVLEENMINSTVWCYSPENTEADGENWNKEDFSVLGPDRRPRGLDAYNRVSPRFTSGRLVSFKYNSPLAYYEPRPGVPTPVREFTMEMMGLETSAPTEIYVPAQQYPDGFYVYVSDGRCAFDNDRHILYWYPSDDDPNVNHDIRIRPPYPGYGDTGWNYFFLGDEVMEGAQ